MYIHVHVQWNHLMDTGTSISVLNRDVLNVEVNLNTLKHINLYVVQTYAVSVK